MELTTITASSESKQGLQVKTSIRDFELISDEPEEMGGANQGPTPMEIVLTGFGSCLTIMINMLAKKMRLAVEGVKVEVEGDFNRQALRESKDQKPGFQAIRAEVSLSGDISPSQRKDLVGKAEAACPVTDTLKNGAEVSVKLEG